jgi:hypothetical protein
MDVAEAVGILRLRQINLKLEDEALTTLIRETLTMKKALEFYADPNNYLDNVPMLTNPDSNLLEVNDNGYMAQVGLHLIDIAGSPTSTESN